MRKTKNLRLKVFILSGRIRVALFMLSNPLQEAIMDKLKKLLAPTDLSETSLTGVRYALDLARTSGGEVTIYHVVGPEELSRYGYLGLLKDPIGTTERELQRFVDRYCGDLLPCVETHMAVELGTPETNIVDKAKASAADLIVLATHGRTGLSHVLLGSVAERVVRRNAPSLQFGRKNSRKTHAPRMLNLDTRTGGV
jgi:nucleotide-binding universal stress UspA family protein